MKVFFEKSPVDSTKTEPVLDERHILDNILLLLQSCVFEKLIFKLGSVKLGL